MVIDSNQYAIEFLVYLLVFYSIFCKINNIHTFSRDAIDLIACFFVYIFIVHSHLVLFENIKNVMGFLFDLKDPSLFQYIS